MAIKLWNGKEYEALKPSEDESLFKHLVNENSFDEKVSEKSCSD